MSGDVHLRFCRKVMNLEVVLTFVCWLIIHILREAQVFD